MDRLPTARTLRWFVPLAVLLCINALLTFWNIATLRANESMVAHTLEVQNALSETLSTLQDAETGQRGYLITGVASYLEPYTRAVGQMAERLARLKRLTADNPSQQQRLADLEAQVTVRLDLLQKGIDLRSTQGLAAAQQVVLSGQGKQAMDNARALIAAMAGEEQTLLAQRTAESDASARQVIGMFALATLAGLALLVLAAVLVARDTQQRAHAAEALRVEREWFEVTLTSIGDAVIATDTAGRITFMNPLAAQLTGWTRAEATGQEHTTVFRIINETTRAPVESPVAKVLRDGSIAGLANHTLLLARDGTLLPIDDSGAPIHNAQGATIGVVLVFRNISTRYEAEASLRDREERYRALVQATTNVVWTANPRGQDNDANAWWAELTGQAPDEMTGWGWLAAVHPDDRETARQAWAHALATHTMLDVVYRVRARDGSYRSLAVRGVPRLYPDGSLNEWIGTINDISERKQAEDERARLLEREHAARLAAEAAIQVRDQFLSVAAHELRTPLTALLGNAQLLQRRAAREATLAARDGRTLTVIVEQLGRLNTMISALLDVSRIEMGHLTLDPQLFDLCALTERIVREIEPLLVKHTVTCALPAAPLMVLGDEMRVEQVVQNLVSNAIKYSPVGGPITVTLEQRDGSVVLAVRDSGIGIPAEALPQLFQRFYRAPNAEPTRISGMGIGLFVVREIVMLHGGSITVESVEAQGSTFTVTLPLAVAAHDGVAGAVLAR